MLLTTASLVVAFCSDFALYDTCHFGPFPSCCVGYAHRTSKARSALDQNSVNAYLLTNVEAGCELHVMTFSFLEGGIGLRHNFLLSILRVKSAVISRTMYFWVATMRSTTHQRNRWLQLMRVSCFQGLSWGVRSRRCASSWPIISYFKVWKHGQIWLGGSFTSLSDQKSSPIRKYRAMMKSSDILEHCK